MSGRSPRRLQLAVAAVIATTAVLIGSSPVLANGLSLIFPDPVSPNGQDIYNLYLLITIPAIIVFVGVEAALLYIIIRFRRRHPGQVGAAWHGNTTLEIVWTVIPTVIVAVIAFLAFQGLQKDFTVEAANANPDLSIAVTGHQFSWTYAYDGGFKVDNTMAVPVGKMVHMSFESSDVIHSWWVPALTGKTDAVPGYTNQSWIKVDPAVLNNCSGNDRHGDKATGGCLLHGECAELCGVGHAQMQIDVLALSQTAYDHWVQQQKDKATKPSPKPSPSTGASPAASPAASPGPTASPSPSAGASPSPKASP